MIANAATRTTALINGEMDFISNIPVMDVDRLKDAFQRSGHYQSQPVLQLHGL